MSLPKMLLIIWLSLSWQQAGEQPLFLISGSYSGFGLDHLNNIYTIGEQNVIRKYDQDGKMRYSNNFKLLGELFTMDVTNPMEILLHYRDLDYILLVDNTISKIGEMDLNEEGFPEVYAIARSAQDGIWLFDGTDFRLKRIDRNGEVVIKSENLYFIHQKKLKPNYMREQDQRVYLNVPDIGIMIFDQYANYLKTIPVKGLRTFQVNDDVLYYWKDGMLMGYNLKTFKEKSLNLPHLQHSGITEAGVYGDRLYVLDSAGLKVFEK